MFDSLLNMYVECDSAINWVDAANGGDGEANGEFKTEESTEEGGKE